jgi:hypothetical protein
MRRKVVWTRHGERGAALIEVAITLPILLLTSPSILEFGRVYQTWQVVTNAAREGDRDRPARLTVLNPVAKVVSQTSTLGGSTLMLTASAAMRNESAN